IISTHPPTQKRISSLEQAFYDTNLINYRTPATVISADIVNEILRPSEGDKNWAAVYSKAGDTQRVIAPDDPLSLPKLIYQYYLAETDKGNITETIGTLSSLEHGFIHHLRKQAAEQNISDAKDMQVYILVKMLLRLSEALDSQNEELNKKLVFLVIELFEDAWDRFERVYEEHRSIGFDLSKSPEIYKMEIKKALRDSLEMQKSKDPSFELLILPLYEYLESNFLYTKTGFNRVANDNIHFAFSLKKEDKNKLIKFLLYLHDNLKYLPPFHYLPDEYLEENMGKFIKKARKGILATKPKIDVNCTVFLLLDTAVRFYETKPFLIPDPADIQTRDEKRHPFDNFEEFFSMLLDPQIDVNGSDIEAAATLIRDEDDLEEFLKAVPNLHLENSRQDDKFKKVYRINALNLYMVVKSVLIGWSKNKTTEEKLALLRKLTEIENRNEFWFGYISDTSMINDMILLDPSAMWTPGLLSKLARIIQNSSQNEQLYLDVEYLRKGEMPLDLSMLIKSGLVHSKAEVSVWNDLKTILKEARQINPTTLHESLKDIRSTDKRRILSILPLRLRQDRETHIKEIRNREYLSLSGRIGPKTLEDFKRYIANRDYKLFSIWDTILLKDNDPNYLKETRAILEFLSKAEKELDEDDGYLEHIGELKRAIMANLESFLRAHIHGKGSEINYKPGDFYKILENLPAGYMRNCLISFIIRNKNPDMKTYMKLISYVKPETGYTQYQEAIARKYVPENVIGKHGWNLARNTKRFNTLGVWDKIKLLVKTNPIASTFRDSILRELTDDKDLNADQYVELRSLYLMPHHKIRVGLKALDLLLEQNPKAKENLDEHLRLVEKAVPPSLTRDEEIQRIFLEHSITYKKLKDLSEDLMVETEKPRADEKQLAATSVLYTLDEYLSKLPAREKLEILLYTLDIWQGHPKTIKAIYKGYDGSEGDAREIFEGLNQTEKNRFIEMLLVGDNAILTGNDKKVQESFYRYISQGILRDLPLSPETKISFTHIIRVFLKESPNFKKVQFLRVLSQIRGDIEPSDLLAFILERIGSVYIKGGQIMAFMTDIKESQLHKALLKLIDHAIPFPKEESYEILVSEGKDEVVLGELIGAGSMAQVFSASVRTKDLSPKERKFKKKKGKVAVKIIRPRARKELSTDLEVLDELIKFINLRPKDFDLIIPGNLVPTLRGTLEKELDLGLEVKNYARMKKVLEDLQSEEDTFAHRTPFIYESISSSNALFMEEIEGARLTDPDAMNELGIDKTELNIAILKKLLGELEHGTYQADPNPGSFMVSKDKEIIHLDPGAIGTISPENLELVKDLFTALANRDGPALTGLIVELYLRQEPGKRSALKIDLITAEINALLKLIGILGKETPDAGDRETIEDIVKQYPHFRVFIEKKISFTTIYYLFQSIINRHGILLNEELVAFMRFFGIAQHLFDDLPQEKIQEVMVPFLMDRFLAGLPH
ncbi:AarF/UbiB family protein, partial [Candidatus Auribacterota bacterium]